MGSEEPASASRNDQLRAAQHLAEYPQRVDRLRLLWIDINGGGQRFNSSSPSRSALRSGTPTRRPSPPSRTGSSPQLPESSAIGNASVAARPAVRTPSPPPRPREASPTSRSAALPQSARPKREARRTPSPARVVGGSAPSRATRTGSPRTGRPVAKAKQASAATRGRAAQRGDAGPTAQAPLTRRQIQELMSRDITPEDYELLLMLDEGVKKKSLLSVQAAAALPRATGTDWINEECRICLCALEEDEDIRMLPTCGHLFHAPCAERWLSGSKNTCPLCGQVEEVQEKVVKAFGRFDTNSDGLVHVSEMKKVLFKLDPKGWTQEAVDVLFQAVDIDQDGKINTEEFVTWLFGASSGKEQQLLRGALNI